jgi:hypothetical protein
MKPAKLRAGPDGAREAVWAGSALTDVSTESGLAMEVRAESMAKVAVSWAWVSPWGLAWIS